MFRIEPYDTPLAPFPCTKPGKDIPCDAILIRLNGCNILWDSDFAFTGRRLARCVKEALGDERLDYILLSHSHYDHAAGVPYLKELFPKAVVIAGAYAAEVFQRESARKRMLELDDAVADLRGEERADRERFHTLRADITVRDGDELTLGGHRVKVIEVPGHTRDCVCYYFEQEDFLLSTETLGVYIDGGIMAMHMLLGCEPTTASLQKMLTKNIGAMMLPHGAGVVVGAADCRAFFETALKAAADTRDLVWNAASAGQSEEEIMAALASTFRASVSRDTSVVKSMETNARYTTLALLREREKAEKQHE